MIFQGELSKYHPADALMFLSQLSLNGALSVAHGQRMLTLSFGDGHLLDAQSDAGDDKIMKIMRSLNAISRDQEARIGQVRAETGMSVRQVLGKLDFFPLSRIKHVLELGISEVLLELFLLEEGLFHFTDTPVDPDSSGIKIDTGAAVIKVLSHSDEVRNFEKDITSLNRRVVSKATEDQIDALADEERALVQLAPNVRSLRELLVKAPLYTHRAMEIAEKLIKGDIGAIDHDPVFQAVHKTGIGFFGKIFPSPLIDKAVQLPSAGECALLPIITKPQLSIFFYAFSSTAYTGLSPHHYLELLSWMMATPGGTAPRTASTAVAAPADATAGSLPTTPPPAETAPSEAAAKLVAKIDELPPLPSMASKSLQLLSDPETQMETIERTIAHDQALVGKIIKVSNSALYGGCQKVDSLRQALTRLWKNGACPKRSRPAPNITTSLKKPAARSFFPPSWRMPTTSATPWAAIPSPIQKRARHLPQA